MNPIDFDNPTQTAIPESPDPPRPSILARRWRRTPQRRVCLSLFGLAALLAAVIALFGPRDDGGLASWTLPELTDDLRHIAVVYSLAEGARVYVGETPNKDWRVVSGAPPGATSVKWILGGRRLLVTTDDKGAEIPQLWVLAADSGRLTPLSTDKRAAYRSPIVSPSGNLVAYSSNERRLDAFDVYVVDCTTLQRRLVVESTDYCSAEAFSPDEKRLCVKHLHDSHDSDVDVVDLSTGKAMRVTPHQGKAVYSDCVWSPSGSIIHLVTNQDREFKRIGEIDLNQKSPRVAVGKDALEDVTSISASRDGRYITTTLLYKGTYWTSVTELATNRILPLPYDKGVFHASFTADSKHVLLDVRGSMGGPMRYVVDLRTFASTPVGELRPVHRGAVIPEWVRYRSSDGTEVHALLYVPRGTVADGTHPLIVMFHGGPESLWLPNYSIEVQQYLSHGYIVLEPNIRGSTGRGRSWEGADDVTKRRVALEDGAAAARWAIESKWADPHKIVAMGASYGGYMTLCMLAYYPDLFAAGVDKMGMSDLVSFLKHLRPWTRADRMSEYGDPVKDADFLRSVSPVYAAGRVRAPLLIIQGANDPRVPPEQSEEMVKAVRKGGGTVEYLVIPQEGHGWTSPGDFTTDVHTTTAFLDKYVGNRK